MIIASSSIVVKETEAESTIVPNWLELPRDITANILLRLDTSDIVQSVCLVCPLWWNIFKDPLMWRSIHMTNFKCFSEMEKICRYAVERSCGHLSDIDIVSFGTDDLLRCIAQNGSNLRSMRLGSCSCISDKGLCEAVRKLSRLEELDISHCLLSKDSLEVIGISCPLLKSLTYIRTWVFSIQGYDDSEAFTISETMSRLSRLVIKGIMLTDVGLVAILDKCPLLEYLDLQECYTLYLSESLRKRCIEQIKYLRLPVIFKRFQDSDYEYDDCESWQDSHSRLDDDYSSDDSYDHYYD